MSRLHYTRLLCCRAPLQCCSAGCAGDAAPRSSRPSLAQVSGWCGHSGLARTSAPPPLPGSALTRHSLVAGPGSAGGRLVFSWSGHLLPPSTGEPGNGVGCLAWPGMWSVLTWAYRIMGTFTIRFLFFTSYQLYLKWQIMLIQGSRMRKQDMLM